MLRLVEIDVHRGLERRAELAGGAQPLELARDVGLQRDHGIPVDRVRRRDGGQFPPGR